MQFSNQEIVPLYTLIFYTNSYEHYFIDFYFAEGRKTIKSRIKY